MKDIRIGNDIIVSWSIFAEGEPYSLEGKEVTLYLCSQFGKRKAEGYAITGNQITWTFFGKEQKHSGKYSLELVINEDAEGMITTDACDFVNLVDCSCKVGGADDAGVQTESIALTSTLEYVAGSGGGESYDDTYLRTEVARLEREKADKTKLDDLSAETSEVKNSIRNNGLIGKKTNAPQEGDIAEEDGLLYEYSSNAKVYDKKYKAVIGAVGANEFLFQQGYRYEMLNKVEAGNSLGVVEFIPVAFEKAIFGEVDGNGNRLAEKYELSLYFNESDRIANTNQQIAFFDANKTHIVNTWYFGLSQPSDDKKYGCVLTTLTPNQALEEAQDATRIYKFTINLAKTTDGNSTWGIDANGNLYGTLADVKYIGYSIPYSTARAHSIMLNNDYSLEVGWENTKKTINRLMASENNFGKVRMWLSQDAEGTVLNISTEL